MANHLDLLPKQRCQADELPRFAQQAGPRMRARADATRARATSQCFGRNAIPRSRSDMPVKEIACPRIGPFAADCRATGLRQCRDT